MGFFCDLAEEGEIRLEEEELSLAEWVDYRDVPDDPEGLSLTREMMTYFRKQRGTGVKSLTGFSGLFSRNDSRCFH